MKRTLTALLIFASICFELCGCANNSKQSDTQNGDTSKTQEISKNPIESLSSEEKTIFDALIIASDSFHSPQSIKVLNVKNVFGAAISNGDVVEDFYGPRCLIEISAETKAGGNSRKEYVLWTSEWGDKANETVLIFAPQVYHKNGTIVEYNSDSWEYVNSKNKRDFENVDIGNLNRALTQHWEDLGII